MTILKFIFYNNTILSDKLESCSINIDGDEIEILV
ncbi:hypothetical protein AK40_6147 (plasmid) [Bacillus cereus 03BB108]|uniref:Uncharacterized protein n=1 Tax=Bacillus cereus 03BB108 TaxID=451709 RepID=A0AAN0W552_BACCE|nr:hypothetical protein AK40_6147 [Bacillus cereus 03BB108]